MDGVSYSDLDPTLGAWAGRHGLHVFTRSRDDEARGITIVDDAGDTYLLTVAPTGAGLVSVGAAVGCRAA